MASGYAYLALLTALTILSLRTIVILKREAPWTTAGWACTILYDCGASSEILSHTHMPLHAPYIALAALIVAFLVAGVRDEPQGDPWWWPSRLALTRAERQRIAKASR
jgi:hypothetical protein